AIGAGGVIGAIVSSTYHGGRLARVFALSLVGWGLPIALVAPSPQLLAALVLLGIVGAANSVEDVSGFTLLQRAIRDDALSGVLGLIWGAAMGAPALGSIATPLLVRELGARSALVPGGFLHGQKESGAGDYFGEIALLRDVPRTATVTAAAATRLCALERADFLAAVTGHTLAEAAAQGVVGERLAAGQAVSS